MESMELGHLLLNADDCCIEEIRIEGGELYLILESRKQEDCCPYCGCRSRRLHSTYLRYPRDLPWAAWPVRLQLRVKRFFCLNERCAHTTFAEQFSGFLARYARQTDRVLEKQRRLGVNVCALVAEKLLALEGVGVSDTTVIRRLLQLPEPEHRSVRILGVDDWAKRKGQRYGTILVDLERGQIIDLLEDRTAETLAAWLHVHTGLEIVSRDRSKTYAQAIDAAAPGATQVADRWHLIKNAADALFKILQQEYSLLRKYLNPAPETTILAETPPDAAEREALTPAEQRRKERIEQVQQLHGRGWTQKRIAAQLNIHPKTVRRYLRRSSPKSRRRRRGRMLHPYQPYLLQRWNEGCHNASQLFREIQPRGFAGGRTVVADAVRRMRQASGLAARVRKQTASPLAAIPVEQPPSLRTLVYWMLQRPEQRREEQEALIAHISSELPKLSKAIALARSFAAMVRLRQPDQLEAWLLQARHSGYRAWNNFADGLQQDQKAVQAALTYPWSNGPTEGHINRLKCLKRLMYGRAKDPLLRKRVLWQGRWGFT